jgi:predicted CoA-binding protein
MEQSIIDFVGGKRIAVVGVSRSGKKFGNLAYTELAGRGYEVFAVHPEAQEIAGAPCYPNLAALSGKVDGVLIILPAQKAIPVLREAAAAGVRNVWLQQGAESAEVMAAARDLGLNMVTGKCILMYAQPVRGFHALHRGFVRLFGKL